MDLFSATEHDNTEVGNIYIGNCVEAMGWASDHVGYIIDAGNGISKVRSCHVDSLVFSGWRFTSSSVSIKW